MTVEESSEVKRRPSYEEGRLRNGELAQRQTAVSVRARLIELLRSAARVSDVQADDEQVR
jgi:hypothetical protein